MDFQTEMMMGMNLDNPRMFVRLSDVVETAEGFRVWVPGTPVAWKRPDSIGKRRFTSKEMEDYRNRIFVAWATMGSPKLHSHYWTVEVNGMWERPASHILADGVSLSAIGKRVNWPCYMDGDNLLKHIDVFVKAEAVPDDRYAIRKVYQAGWYENTGLLFSFRGVG
jgi:hypothetical protein